MDSLQELEEQSKERIDLLEALKLSRQEAAEKDPSLLQGSPRTTTKPARSARTPHPLRHYQHHNTIQGQAPAGQVSGVINSNTATTSTAPGTTSPEPVRTFSPMTFHQLARLAQFPSSGPTSRRKDDARHQPPPPSSSSVAASVSASTPNITSSPSLQKLSPTQRPDPSMPHRRTSLAPVGLPASTASSSSSSTGSAEKKTMPTTLRQDKKSTFSLRRHKDKDHHQGFFRSQGLPGLPAASRAAGLAWSSVGHGDGNTGMNNSTTVLPRGSLQPNTASTNRQPTQTAPQISLIDLDDPPADASQPTQTTGPMSDSVPSASHITGAHPNTSSSSLSPPTPANRTTTDLNPHSSSSSLRPSALPYRLTKKAAPPPPIHLPQDPRHRNQTSSGNHNASSQNSAQPVVQESSNPPANESVTDAFERRRDMILKNLPRGIDVGPATQILDEIVVLGDDVYWDDIAGLATAKKALKEAVVYPFLRPDLFMGLREPARGMLLFGPPGTGKTMLARAVATESHSTFFSVSATTLTSKWHGESERLVRALFAVAKAMAPSIIFVDEIDSLLSGRSSSGEADVARRTKTEFLIQWSDLQRAAAGREKTNPDDKNGNNTATGDASRVLVLAATNTPWVIDEAARRRFVKRQYIPLPESEVRKMQLGRLMQLQKHDLSDSDLDKLVSLTEGFSGSDITALAKDAALGPLRHLGEALLHTSMEDIRPICVTDFEASLTSIRPSVSREGLEQYERWSTEFGERAG